MNPEVEVYHVEWTANGALVATWSGVVLVDADEAAEVEARCAPWEAARDAWVESLTPAERAAAAGLTSGEPLTARQPWAQSAVAAALWLVVGWMSVLAADVFGAAPAWLSLAVAVGFLLATLSRAAWRLTVDGEGLTTTWCGRRRHWRWSELRACGGDDEVGFVVLTRRGRWRCPRHDRVRAAVRRLLSGRAAAVPAHARGCFAAARRPGCGLWLDDRGLVEVRRRSATRTPTSALSRPLWLRDGLRLGLGDRTVELDRYIGGEALAHALAAQLGGGEPTLSVDATDIEAWLGVPPGGALRAELSRLDRWFWGCALAAGAALGLLAGLPGLAVSGTLAGLAWRELTGSAQADATGVTLQEGGRRTYIAWEELEAVTVLDGTAYLVSRAGRTRLRGALVGTARLVAGLRRVLAARESGVILPDARPAPAGALSRLAAPADEGERGLSLSEREES